jgi:Cu2+-containing amine oxidase
MLLWATYDAGNYEYIMQYGFRDDGTITFRLGSTGYNSPFMPFEPHMHNALWYVDINLADGQHNTVSLMRHIEPGDPTPSATLCSTNNPHPNLASDCMPPFHKGFEGGVDWNDKEFNGLNIVSTTVKNAQGNNIGYDFMPMRMGTARHAEDYTQHDFWVTIAKQNETEYKNLGDYLLDAKWPIYGFLPFRIFEDLPPRQVSTGVK